MKAKMKRPTKEQIREQEIEALCQRLADMLSGVHGGDWQDFDIDLFGDLQIQPGTFGQWLDTIESCFFADEDGKLMDTGILFHRGQYHEWRTIRDAAERVKRWQELLAMKGT